MLLAMRLSLLRRSTATTIVILLASGPGAAAQNPAVEVDPDSPAGTEYALPVDQARLSAGASASTAAREGAPFDSAGPALFGEGVTPPPADATSRRRARQASPTGAPARSPGSAGARETPRTSTPVGEPSDSPVAWLLGSGALVLLVGAGLSRALRHVARPSES